MYLRVRALGIWILCRSQELGAAEQAAVSLGKLKLEVSLHSPRLTAPWGMGAFFIGGAILNCIR